MKKPVLHFQETPKGLVLDDDMLRDLEQMFGSSDPKEWLGKKIVIYADNVTGQIRLKRLQ